MTRPRQRVVLHVGLPKTGTTYLQAVLAHHRDALREAGVLYPFVRPQAMFLGAVEVRGSREKFGLTAEDVAGTWQALCDRVLSHAGYERDQPRGPGRRRARRDRGGAGAPGGDRRRRRGHRTRPGPPGHRALAGGGQARRHPLVRRARARPAPGRCPGRGAAALLARPGLRRGAAPVGDGGPGRTRPPGRGAAAGRRARRAVAAVRGGVRHQPGGRGRRRCRRRGPGQPLADDRGDRPAAGGQPGARRSAHAARARPASSSGSWRRVGWPTDRVRRRGRPPPWPTS